MTATLRITRTKGGVSKSFIFEEGEVKQTSAPAISQSVSLSLVKDSAFDSTENFTIDLGIRKELGFEWKLIKEGTDRSEGTNGTPIQTYEEMMNYLEDVIFFPGAGLIQYQLTVIDKFRTRTAIYDYEDSGFEVDTGIYPKGTAKFKWKRQVI